MMVDKKALIREYKRTPKQLGIIRIRNKATGRALIAASVDVQALLNRNRAELQLKGHRDRALQQEWNESDGATFEFEILDTLEPSDQPGYNPADDLRALEQMWREKLSTP